MPGREFELALEDWLSRSDGDVCLVFADIVGSALLVHGQGTRVYAHVLSAYRLRAERLARALDGHIVSKEGDEIFAAFLNAVTGFRFARELNDDGGHALISVRVGLHVGHVSCHEARLVGRAVPLAARVMDHAGPHEIWISDMARQALIAEDPSLETAVPWVTSEVAILHGIPEPQVLWRAA
jgi:class 3 adenylate cyclase